MYLKSEENYVELFYLSGNEVKSELLRNTLKAVERMFEQSPFVLRCHRGYIINPKKILKIKEDKRQIVLELGNQITIPVSQKYLHHFQKRA